MSIEKNNKKQSGKDPYSIAEMKKQWEFITNEEGICLTGYKGNDKELFIPERIGKNPVTRIRNSALAGKDIVIVTIPESVTHIGKHAFQNCRKLTTVCISGSVRHIEAAAFEGCSNLTAFEIDVNNPIYCFKNQCLIENEDTIIWGQKDSVIPPDIKKIGDYAFCGCKGLTTIRIPDSVKVIGDFAFCGCSGLTNITIPEGVTTIGEKAFFDCSGLVNATMPESIMAIGSGAFNECDKLSCTKFNNAKYLGSRQNAFFFLHSASNVNITSCEVHPDTHFIMPDAFIRCREMTTVTIPAGVVTIGEGAFRLNNNLKDIVIDPENKVYSCVGHCLIENGNAVIWGGEGSVIPSDGKITTIKKHAFGFLKKLTSITIPLGVTYIGKEAFRHCENLTAISFPDSLTNIDESAFYECERLKAVIIPNSVSRIGKNAFKECSRMESVVLSERLTEIPASAFEGCRNLREVIIPQNVTYIADCAFSECKKITSVVIPENVEHIEYLAFRGCTALRSVTILNPDIKIDASAFGKLDGVVVKAPAGSAAEQYAIKKKAVFRDLNSEEDGYKQTEEIIIESNKKGKKKPICHEGEYIVRYRFINSMSLKWSVWQYCEDVFESVEDAMNWGVGDINIPDTCLEGEAEIIDYTGKAVAFSSIC